MDGNEYAVKFIKNLKMENIPPKIVKQAKICLLDLLGASLGGVKAKGAKILFNFSSQEINGLREATVIKANKKMSCVAASLINGFMVNALDIDDGFRKIKGHPGAAIFPTVLAVSEKVKATGKEFIEALIIGYEIAIRAGEILLSHYGFYHGSGSWGAIGAAAGAARLLDLPEIETKNALGIAEAFAPLVPEMRSVKSPSMAPKDGIPWGAMVGASAVFLAQKKFTGIPSLLGDIERNKEVFTLNKEYKMMNLYFKQYPCCRWAHPAIDGVLKIMEKENFTYREISKIIIKTFSEAVRLCPDPPTSLENAEYNVRYPVAMAAIYKEFGPTQLEEKYYNDEVVNRIMEKISLIRDNQIEEKFPEKCLAEITIITQQGKEYNSGTIAAKGDWDYPLSEQELENKFIRIVQGVLSKEETNDLIKVVKNFENYQVKDLIKFLT
ncbi:MAG: MmgE/PrpD family protein [Atribacterota bacterium]|nr:MmgE/PrpD family protein [Atribacterota bacterium]